MKKFLIVHILLVIAGVLQVLNASSGPEKKQGDAGDTIKIGLLISDTGFQEANRGAELAVMAAMQNDQFKDRPVQLITRSMEGLWGTGAKQTVDLVFNQKVWAIIGSHDGRNAHLAEQVIAKTQVVYISAWAGDPTLSQAYVPWYFSVVPDNIQQAKVLAKAVFQNNKNARLTVISDLDYDATTALKFFKAELNESQLSQIHEIKYDASKLSLDDLLSTISPTKQNEIVLFGEAHESKLILDAIRSLNIDANVYTSFISLGEDVGVPFELSNFENTFLPDAKYWNSISGKDFAKQYKEQYGVEPGPTAAYAYDALLLILEKIADTNFDRGAFRENMRNANFTGITGSINFDKLGNRVDAFHLVKIQNNCPCPVDY